MAVCPNCNKQATTDTHGGGDLVCVDCGISLEQSRIVSDVTFAETSSGKAVVTGQYVSNDQSGVVGNSLYGLQTGESRLQTIEKAKQRMERIGRKIGIHEHIIEGGVRFFRIALANNFVKGRRSQHVLSACLYLSCRLGNTDHMLLDFAEVLKVNVFNIGATYLQLLKNQSISKLPIVDPTVFIQRFVARLHFPPEGARRVVNDAKLLVQRMGKDWLQQGRRPAGVAAACILLATRMNNFRRSKAEIVEVAKIAEETLQRRLNEFKHTPAGTLTVSDFRDTNVDSAADPPSFTRHRELEKLYAEKKAREEELEALGEDTEDVYLDRELEKLAKELDKEDGETLKLSTDVEAVLKIPELQQAYKDMEEYEAQVKEAERLRDEAEQLEAEARNEMQNGVKPSRKKQKALPEAVSTEAAAEESNNEAEKPASESKAPENDNDDDDDDDGDSDRDNEASGNSPMSRQEEAEVTVAILGPGIGIINQNDDSGNDTPFVKEGSVEPSKVEESVEVKISESQAAELESVGIKKSESQADSAPGTPSESGDPPAGGMGRAEKFLAEFRKKRAARLALEAAAKRETEVREKAMKELPPDPMDEHLSEVDDDEIESVLLTEDEIDIKTRVWMSINREYLIEQERKRLRAEADKANGNQKPQRKRRKTEKKSSTPGGPTAADSATNMIREKAHSKKINYAAFQKIFSKGGEKPSVS